MWEWRQQYGGTIIEQLKRLGASCDYAEERFTLDEAYVQAVLKVFVALHEKGYIYRDRYMVNWDPGSRSAISDLEVEPRDVSDTLYYIDYPLASGGGSITVATVRPETMLADTAIAVHPDDERYRRLIGEKAILPLVGRKLKIIADEYVKPEFGTGALKITPAHDPNDFEIGRRHGLGQPQVIGEDGRITDEAPERFVGMTVSEAQAAVVAELREQGLIARTEAYHHDVPFSQRSGERIEPLISLQWFMAMDELAQTGDRGGDQRPDPLLPREPHPRVPGMDARTSVRGASRGSCGGAIGCRSGTAASRRMSEPRPRRARAGRATLTSSTPGFRARCGRSRRSAGPTQTPELARLLPDRRARHRTRHHLPLGRADDHDGPRVHRP